MLSPATERFPHNSHLSWVSRQRQVNLQNALFAMAAGGMKSRYGTGTIEHTKSALLIETNINSRKMAGKLPVVACISYRPDMKMLGHGLCRKPGAASVH